MIYIKTLYPDPHSLDFTRGILTNDGVEEWTTNTLISEKDTLVYLGLGSPLEMQDMAQIETRPNTYYVLYGSCLGQEISFKQPVPSRGVFIAVVSDDFNGYGAAREFYRQMIPIDREVRIALGKEKTIVNN